VRGEVRIIGGEFRGRKLKIPAIADLRPTPDRVRETLFNWLAPIIQGAHCLDAFAGSGVLGFEAISRGAARVVMLDQSDVVVMLLQEELERFKIKNAEVYQANLPLQLKKPEKPFDIVFLDPPYQASLLKDTSVYLEENGFLAPNAWIYLESNQTLTAKDLPPHWEIMKSKKAGLVAYHLARRLV
jgi:16S rRNA (guanine966-N2)-methyltransferase